ncbi:prepilin peptidase [Polycladomyces sp. WAk]|uniref:Prepilin peptidase n=1 Tax=Polycladomyces zharkentensis TaxID=2807616 RepID=A0ABS2WM87_9BACL|nr:prepilin peptidase [Polycladomyces sp. WAk]
MGEHIVFIVLLILTGIASVTDLRERLIYDRVVLVGAAFAIMFRLWYRVEPWWDYLLTGFGVLFVLATIGALTGATAIGGGDIKLFAMIGLCVGWEKFFVIFLISHVLAALVAIPMKLFSRKADWKSTLPMAPFIFTGTLVTYVLYLF